MLSAQTNSLGRGYAAAPITDWFNPSTAHHYLCRSESVFTALAKIRELPVNSTVQPAGHLTHTSALPSARAARQSGIW